MGIDFSTDHGQRAFRQLEQEEIIWLTTVSLSGTPQPNPVWFQYVADDVIVYTQTTAARLKNIEANNRVSLNFNTSEDGEAVTVLTGTISIDDEFSKVAENPAYIEKYAKGLAFINSSPGKMSAEYPVVMRIKLEKLRGW